MIAIPVTFYWLGPRIRAKSKYSGFWISAAMSVYITDVTTWTRAQNDNM
jgi:hypothetical protein